MRSYERHDKDDSDTLTKDIVFFFIFITGGTFFDLFGFLCSY